ncbi:MAG TPA: hypothetical protein VNZ52_16465 [Candidatus Thermoplasmatota archaeon]|nr:hypothetical protein [Candidatus Thermoplasmatota archaeon]
MAMHGSWRDERGVHLLTRGNVDGIVSSAFAFAAFPEARASYVPSATPAIELLRKDISSHSFYLIDIGLTPRLIKTLNQKGKTGQEVVFIDHHQQSEIYAGELGPHVRTVCTQGPSAATVALDHFALTNPDLHREELTRVAALADLVEYCDSPYLEDAIDRYGLDLLQEEAAHLDFAWRLQIEDDRFRAHAARRLARGLWPSEIPEVKSRYLQMVNENRWLRAKERVKSRMVVQGNVGILNFGKEKTSLLGFGSRALHAVARDAGCSVAVLVNRRKQLTSLALRAVGETQLNLGQFVEDFTKVHGVSGGA